MKRLLSLSAAAASVGVGLVVVASPASAAYYANCTQARAAGQTDIPRSSSSYRAALDRDGDGIACESGGESSTSTSTSAGATTTSSGGGLRTGSITVNTGSGGQADRISSAVPVAAGGLGVLVLGGSAVALRRRSVAGR
ncbi:MAG TPA: excalibur calcium-binding domain-containing protein [Frankiaceae bacterium]|nr:excalibur calcium-binding domain-containing protein [Frankiaceae bacterium]